MRRVAPNVATFLGFVVAIAAVSILGATGCEKPDDVTQIRTLIDTAVDAAENHDINGMMEHVTGDFRVNPGNRDEQAARGVLLIALRRFGRFDVKYPVPAITVDPDGVTATASVPFLVVPEAKEFPDLTAVRDDPTKWLEQAGDAMGEPYRLTFELTKASGDWLVRSATLQSTRSLGSGGRY
jgi:hypothetical protein